MRGKSKRPAAPARPGCRLATRAQIAFATGTVVIGLGACGSQPTRILDTEKVERAIEQSILQKRHISAQVSCPSGTPQRTGYAFRCLATYRGGQTVFVVTEENANGGVYYVGVRATRASAAGAATTP